MVEHMNPRRAGVFFHERRDLRVIVLAHVVVVEELGHRRGIAMHGKTVHVE